MNTLILDNGLLHLELLPELAGGIARLDWVAGGKAIPVLRPRSSSADPQEPNTLACYAMVPWSNRIGHGRFDFGGTTHTLPPTRSDEAYPIHGHGAFSAWETLASDASSAELYLQYSGTPFTFEAWQRYQLSGNRLAVTVSVRNLGQRLPFGLGLHPFFPRDDATRLTAPARSLWQAGSDNLPTQLSTPEGEWDFNLQQALPASTMINHGYAGWSGRAEVLNRDVHTQITADAGHYVLYTPPGQDFFCFEPADHSINAHNYAGNPAESGLTILETGQTLSRRFQFTVHPSDEAAA
ncbi:hypothetical protein IGB42_01382 [Andreprevotia sp. IGB-42]|uniref:aldose 1-epimerase n=1 Tax=Andreprevotia sp. IGB-42 TaxID=2497473 RepID=UPI0013568550|nr:aldose 1-epimerase [Andreprevotia sp. IGB-42]KAF0814481.1 hypothetical protein IGB42_01382 [Andreprevotia sp. IGB-42]